MVLLRVLCFLRDELEGIPTEILGAILSNQDPDIAAYSIYKCLING